MATFYLVDVDGTAHNLNGTGGVYLRRGVSGAGGPLISPGADKLPYAPGSKLRRVSTPGVSIQLPIKLESTSETLLDPIFDTLRGWLAPGTENEDEPSTVYFRVTRADGASREIECVYVRGLEGNDAAGMPWWHRLVIELYAPHPYWSDVSSTTVTFTSGTGTQAWFPIFPLVLTESSVFAEQTVTNTGQIESWPIWTITGPGSGLILRNTTTGENLELDYTVAAGEVVTIDTRPRKKTIVNQNGVNLFGYLTADSAIWALLKGANVVRIILTGTTVASSVGLTYKRQWLGGHR